MSLASIRVFGYLVHPCKGLPSINGCMVGNQLASDRNSNCFRFLQRAFIYIICICALQFSKVGGGRHWQNFHFADKEGPEVLSQPDLLVVIQRRRQCWDVNPFWSQKFVFSLPHLCSIEQTKNWVANCQIQSTYSLWSF